MAGRASGAFTREHFREWSSMLVLDTDEPWEIEEFQLDVVADVFDGFREVWMVVPEENAKTTLMAALALALYHCDYTKSPWVPIGASSRDQALILHSQGAGFVRRSPGMNKRFRVYDGYRQIVSLRNPGPGIRVYSADKGTGDGVIPTLCIVDEGHRHKDLGLYRTWKGKLRKRGAQIVMISTAGEPGGDFEETRDNIRTAATDHTRQGPAYLRAEGPNIVLHEWKVPDPDRAKDLEVVLAANPLAKITAEALRDKLGSPTIDYGEDWLRLTCNIPARSGKAAISDQEFDDAATDEEIPEGESIDCGMDVAWKWDTTAIAPLWMPELHKRLIGDPAILTPPRDGSMLNSHLIEDALLNLHQRTPIRRLVMDREKGEQIAAWAEEELGIEVIDRPRSNAASSEDFERFMEALREGWLKHTGHPEFRRHAMNAIARVLPGDKRRFDRPVGSRHDKKEQERRVIDALDAASMVHTVTEATFEPVLPMIGVVSR